MHYCTNSLKFSEQIVETKPNPKNQLAFKENLHHVLSVKNIFFLRVAFCQSFHLLMDSLFVLSLPVNPGPRASLFQWIPHFICREVKNPKVRSELWHFQRSEQDFSPQPDSLSYNETVYFWVIPAAERTSLDQWWARERKDRTRWNNDKVWQILGHVGIKWRVKRSKEQKKRICHKFWLWTDYALDKLCALKSARDKNQNLTVSFLSLLFSLNI